MVPSKNLKHVLTLGCMLAFVCTASAEEKKTDAGAAPIEAQTEIKAADTATKNTPASAQEEDKKGDREPPVPKGSANKAKDKDTKAKGGLVSTSKAGGSSENQENPAPLNPENSDPNAVNGAVNSKTTAGSAPPANGPIPVGVSPKSGKIIQETTSKSDGKKTDVGELKRRRPLRKKRLKKQAKRYRKKGATRKTRRRVKKKRSMRQKWPIKRPQVNTVIPPLGPAPYSTGERLFFKLEMFGTKAGEVALVVGKTQMVEGRQAQELVGFIRGSEFLNKFYPVNNRLDAMVDSQTMLPLKSNFFIREKGSKSDYHTVYDHHKRLIRSIRFKKQKKLYRNFSQATDIYESLGSVYGVRRMDLKVGMSFNYYIWDSRKERLIRVVVTGEERIQTEAGWFDTVRLDVSAQITGGFMKNKQLNSPIRKGSIWIAKDRYKTPVKVLTPTKLGDATATLVRRVMDGELDQ